MFQLHTARLARYSLLFLFGAPILTFVTLSLPWLVVTGQTPIPFMSDTNVTYGVFCFSSQTGMYDVIRITGDFPHARYVSFMVYGGSRSQPFSVLSDYEIKPDPGSVNPFLPYVNRAATNRRYTIYAIREGSGINPSAYDNVLIIPASETFINLMMRIYRPDDGLDTPAGGVPLPTVEAGSASGQVQPPAYGLLADPAALEKMFVNVHYLEAAIFPRLHSATKNVEFYHLTRQGGLPNANVPYLDTSLGETVPGPNAKLAVLNFRPPTFEDTHLRNSVITGTKDTRYYSFCTSDIATGFNSQCISDNELKINKDGTVTLVVYPPALENVVIRSGLNRLVRGYTATTSLTYRQLLPTQSFFGSARNVPALPLPLPPDMSLEYYKASNHIGEYAPGGAYYTGPQFEEWFRQHQGQLAGAQ